MSTPPGYPPPPGQPPPQNPQPADKPEKDLSPVPPDEPLGGNGEDLTRYKKSQTHAHEKAEAPAEA